jgi:hypothetical protein
MRRALDRLYGRKRRTGSGLPGHDLLLMLSQSFARELGLLIRAPTTLPVGLPPLLRSWR